MSLYQTEIHLQHSKSGTALKPFRVHISPGPPTASDGPAMSRPSTLFAPLYDLLCCSRVAGMLPVVESHSHRMRFDQIDLLAMSFVLARRR